MVLSLSRARHARSTSVDHRNRTGLRAIGAALLMLALSACATLPSNAPTLNQVQSGAAARANTIPYTLVDIDAGVAASSGKGDNIDAEQMLALSTDPVPVRADIIHKGDTLSISIFEIGVALFAGQQALTPEPVHTPTANAQQITVQVREDGQFELPYLGAFNAEGTVPEQLAKTIGSRLRRYSESPQVVVTIADSVENAVYVTGTIVKPGRYRLSQAHERLLDMLALAGGPNINVNDAEVRLVRRDRVATLPLNMIRAEEATNLPLLPGDRIDISLQSKSYTVFGATDRVSQQPFQTQNVTLAEALARVSGPADARANARGVFLFRLQKDENGGPPHAVVYRLNMMKPDSYFLAQMFHVQDKDVILFANSSSNLTSKFITMLNQLFSPVITARVLTQ